MTDLAMPLTPMGWAGEGVLKQADGGSGEGSGDGVAAGDGEEDGDDERKIEDGEARKGPGQKGLQQDRGQRNEHRHGGWKLCCSSSRRDV